MNSRARQSKYPDAGTLADIRAAEAGSPPRRVVIISALEIHPVDSGGKAVRNGFLTYFVRLCGAANVHFVHISRSAAEAQKYPCHYHWVKLPHLALRTPRIVWSALLTRSSSIQEALFSSRLVRGGVDAALDEIAPDLILFDTVRMAAAGWLPRWKDRSYLYLDDLFSLRYQRMLAQKRVDNALGSFAKYMPKLLASAVRMQTVQRAMLRLEARAISRSEARWPSRFRRSLLLNEDEVRILQPLCGGAEVRSIAPWIQVGGVIGRKFPAMKATVEFIFLGLLSYSPNEAGLYHFLTEQWPRCVALIPGARLRVIGKYPSPRLLEQAARLHDTVTFEGFVFDIASVLSTAAAFLVPLLFGSGVKIKIIEALAHAIPIVSTPVGVEGVPLQHGREAFIAAPDRFPEHMLRLTDERCNGQMSKACRELYENFYAERVLMESYDSLFDVRAGRHAGAYAA